MKVSILYVVANLDIGGAERHIAQILPKLDKSKINASVFTLINKGALSESLEKKGIQVIGINKNILWQQTNKFGRIHILLRGAIKLFFHLRREQPSVVHFYLPMPYIVGAIVALLARTPILVMSRRSLNDYQKNYRGAAWIEQKLHDYMTYVIGNSKAVLNDLLLEGVPQKKLGLIYNGVELPLINTLEQNEKLRKEFGVGHVEILITIVANLIPYKGHADLLRGLANSKGELPLNWKLICVGNDSHGNQAQLVSLSKTLGIYKHIIFAGGRSDVSNILQASDISVLSSHQEGFSNAVLEGMAASLPLIVTNVGGNAEAIRDGIDGFVVPAHDHCALGEAIVVLSNNDVLRKKMGTSAFLRVSENFSISKCTKEYENLYWNIIQTN